MKDKDFFIACIVIFLLVLVFSIRLISPLLGVISLIGLIGSSMMYNYHHKRDVEDDWLSPYYYLLDNDIGKAWDGKFKQNWRVVTAANRDRQSGLVVAGARHYDKVMRAQFFALSGTPLELAKDWDKADFDDLTLDKRWSMCEQGFIDNYGDFLTRAEAWIVAKHADQLIDYWKCNQQEGFLYSENIH